MSGWWFVIFVRFFVRVVAKFDDFWLGGFGGEDVIVAVFVCGCVVGVGWLGCVCWCAAGCWLVGWRFVGSQDLCEKRVILSFWRRRVVAVAAAVACELTSSKVTALVSPFSQTSSLSGEKVGMVGCAIAKIRECEWGGRRRVRLAVVF